MDWPCFKVHWFSKDNPTGQSERKKKKRGRQKKRWEDNIKEWTGMDFVSSTRAAENRTRWKWIVANSSVGPLTTFQGYGIEYIDSDCYLQTMFTINIIPRKHTGSIKSDAKRLEKGAFKGSKVLHFKADPFCVC